MANENSIPGYFKLFSGDIGMFGQIGSLSKIGFSLHPTHKLSFIKKLGDGTTIYAVAGKNSEYLLVVYPKNAYIEIYSSDEYAAFGQLNKLRLSNNLQITFPLLARAITAAKKEKKEGAQSAAFQYA